MEINKIVKVSIYSAEEFFECMNKGKYICYTTTSVLRPFIVVEQYKPSKELIKEALKIALNKANTKGLSKKEINRIKRPYIKEDCIKGYYLDLDYDSGLTLDFADGLFVSTIRSDTLSKSILPGVIKFMKKHGLKFLKEVDPYE